MSGTKSGKYMGRKLGTMGKDYCPRCGADPSRQRWKPRSKPIDISVYERIDSFNPSDAIQCPNCGMAFQVSRLEVDDEFIVDWSILYEFVPNYCPQCGMAFPEELRS
jgi:ribosomal protein S27AE